jgi:hypothetical protein
MSYRFKLCVSDTSGALFKFSGPWLPFHYLVAAVHSDCSKETWLVPYDRVVQQNKVTEHLGHHLLFSGIVGNESIPLHKSEDRGPDHVKVEALEYLGLHLAHLGSANGIVNHM